MKTYIIIGASAAGIGCITKLRMLDKNSKIICIDLQDNLPYNKCLLADYMSDLIPLKQVFTKDLEFFKKNDIQLLLSTKVIKILPEKNQIFISNNKKFSYDSLFLGLGTKSFIPKITGINTYDNFFNFQTLDDVLKIKHYIKQNSVKNITIIGAGLTGLECADAFSTSKIKINILEKYNQILPKHIDLKGSLILEKLIKKNKINLCKNIIIKEITTEIKINKPSPADSTKAASMTAGRLRSINKKIFYIKFENGKILKTEMIIFALGSKPNIELIKNTEILTKNGRILTNENMQTKIKNIYAGGDICLIKEFITEEFVPSCTWPDAIIQGMTAASNMLGIERIYPEVLNTISSNIFDTQLISCGPVATPPKNYKTIINKDKNFYHKFLIQDDKLIAFLMIGNLKKIGYLKNIILRKEKFII